MTPNKVDNTLYFQKYIDKHCDKISLDQGEFMDFFFIYLFLYKDLHFLENWYLITPALETLGWYLSVKKILWVKLTFTTAPEKNIQVVLKLHKLHRNNQYLTGHVHYLKTL